MSQADKYAELAITADRYNPAGKYCFLIINWLIYLYFIHKFNISGLITIGLITSLCSGKLAHTHPPSLRGGTQTQTQESGRNQAFTMHCRTLLTEVKIWSHWQENIVSDIKNFSGTPNSNPLNNVNLVELTVHVLKWSFLKLICFQHW